MLRRYRPPVSQRPILIAFPMAFDAQMGIDFAPAAARECDPVPRGNQVGLEEVVVEGRTLRRIGGGDVIARVGRALVGQRRGADRAAGDRGPQLGRARLDRGADAQQLHIQGSRLIRKQPLMHL